MGVYMKGVAPMQYPWPAHTNANMKNFMAHQLFFEMEHGLCMARKNRTKEASSNRLWKDHSWH